MSLVATDTNPSDMTEQHNEQHDNPSRMQHAYDVQDGPPRRLQRGYPAPAAQPPPQYQILQERQQPMLLPLHGQYSQQQLYDPQQQPAEPHTNTLDTFILTLLKKPQERIFLLKLEKDLEAFINNHQLYRLDLPQMNSYQRLMVHKVAPYFNLSHFYEPMRKSVFLCKNQFTAM
ncbi:single-stranded nucleic acid binding R3H [Fennellomyces sp. T-0311]|nr:single-stranded nucleic acid binding R3H [Fennellomyces sp. T-0311]